MKNKIFLDLSKDNKYCGILFALSNNRQVIFRINPCASSVAEISKEYTRLYSHIDKNSFIKWIF